MIKSFWYIGYERDPIEHICLSYLDQVLKFHWKNTFY